MPYTPTVTEETDAQTSILAAPYRRIVVKVGTSTLTHDTGHLNLRRMERLVRVLSDIKNAGCETVLVTSGAIGVGASRLGLTAPRELRQKQAAASVGQCQLMHVYDQMFGEYGTTVAQILLTRSDVARDALRQNVKETFYALWALGALPIVNENDAVAFDEIESGEHRFFGDNDALSALVAELVGADLLVLLTDIDALYEADPRQDPNAAPIRVVRSVSDDLLGRAGGAGSKRGTGGMVSKLNAARTALDAKVDMVIASGADPAILYRILKREPVGTIFTTRANPFE